MTMHHPINILKNWVPPVLVKVAAKLLAVDPSKRQRYPSYERALQDSGNPEGYELDNIVKLEYLRTKKIKEDLEHSADMRMSEVDVKGLVCLRAFITKKTINVIDVGGGCGRHYFYTRKILPPDINLNWYVVETAAMCRYGNLIASSELHFRDNLAETITEVGTIDMVYASGVLQCVDKPWEFLELITSCQANYIFFHRLGLSTKKDVIVIHKYSLSWNGAYALPQGVADRVVAYPFTFIEKNRFMEVIQTRYTVLTEFDERSGVFPVSGEDLVGMGIFCELKSEG